MQIAKPPVFVMQVSIRIQNSKFPCKTPPAALATTSNLCSLRVMSRASCLHFASNCTTAPCRLQNLQSSSCRYRSEFRIPNFHAKRLQQHWQPPATCGVAQNGRRPHVMHARIPDFHAVGFVACSISFSIVHVGKSSTSGCRLSDICSCTCSIYLPSERGCRDTSHSSRSQAFKLLYVQVHIVMKQTIQNSMQAVTTAASRSHRLLPKKSPPKCSVGTSCGDVTD